MLAFSAASVGALNAFSSTSATPMPFAPPVMAVFMALTISFTFEFSEPVHWYEQPRSLQASSAPYFVGRKNGLVATRSTRTTFSFLWKPKRPPPPPLDCGFGVALALVGLLLEPQAASAAATTPAVPPVSAARRGAARNLEAGFSSPCLP